MNILKWAHTPSNFARLLFYESWHEAATRDFLQYPMKIYGKIAHKMHFLNTKIFEFWPILPGFWPSSIQNQYKKSVGIRFLKFSFFEFFG